MPRLSPAFYTPADGPRGIICGAALRRLQRTQPQPKADAADLRTLDNHAWHVARQPRAPRLVKAERQDLQTIPLADFLATPPAVDVRILEAPGAPSDRRAFDFDAAVLQALKGMRHTTA